MWSTRARSNLCTPTTDRYRSRRRGGFRLCAALLSGVLMMPLFALPAAAEPVAANTVADSGQATPFGVPFVTIGQGQTVHLDFDNDTPRARLPSAPVRYQRFVLPDPPRDVRISVRAMAEKHNGAPRFTVFSPQLVLLDGNGQMRRIVPLEHMELDIRPFRPTRLRECLVVHDLHGFLLASYPSRLGELYRFNARPGLNDQPDHGFYKTQLSMQVFLTWSDSGPVEVKLGAVRDRDSACVQIPD